jgi:ATP/maltotriose-dependent transcriptional regulator MalT
MADTGANSGGLAEPLTEREQEILTSLAEGLSNQEIANRLHLALRTVKWYNSQIYSKLGVGSREEAVEKAQGLGLLARLPDAEALEGKHNLPSQTTPFIGRQQELADIKVLLAKPDVRLLTILAPGGMGKTRLSIEAARSQIGRYRNGVFFVSVQGVNQAVGKGSSRRGEGSEAAAKCSFVKRMLDAQSV